MIRALLVLVLVAAVAAGPARGDEPDAKKAVGDFSKQVADAMVKGDAMAVKDMLADGWRVTGPGGTHDKAETLAAMKDGTLKYLVMDKSKVEVRVYGDAAVVTGTIRAKISVGGKEQTSTELFTEVFVKKGGKWQCVTVHVSPAAAKDGK
ncbi:MAG TPA: nuclear transport factor 2 family protein [Gemmataceae bacterium]|nr:nuclear transport factor 2 family protein [Gemmataceae bacterium]